MTQEQVGVVVRQGDDMNSERVQYLSVSALGSELTGEELEALAGRIELQKLAPGEPLISEGDQNERLYAIVRGNFSVLRTSSRGQERLNTLGPGMVTGELAFLDGLKRTASVVADADDCCAISLSREQLESLLPTNGVLVYKVMRAVVRSAHRTVNRMDTTYTELLSYIST
jgi:CRP-like cAMP-binding protein